MPGNDLGPYGLARKDQTWSDHGATLAVQAGSTGVTIVFANTGGGSLGISDPRGAAIAMARLILSRL